ncbi:MAG: hypothetical protein IJ340_07615, partial [Odoribacter sp.]|nr:hypothetical protein [Odoribacter sp.]
MLASAYAQLRKVSFEVQNVNLAEIIAILEKHLGFLFNTLDVYLNVVGGFQFREPSCDLAVAM